jgi:hypothetical protein
VAEVCQHAPEAPLAAGQVDGQASRRGKEGEELREIEMLVVIVVARRAGPP